MTTKSKVWTGVGTAIGTAAVMVLAWWGSHDFNMVTPASAETSTFATKDEVLHNFASKVELQEVKAVVLEKSEERTERVVTELRNLSGQVNQLAIEVGKLGEQVKNLRHDQWRDGERTAVK